MNRLAKFFLLFVLVAALLLGLPGPVHAQTPDGDSPVIFGSSYTLPAGKTVKDLVVFGGNAKLDDGSVVTGDVVVFGGNVTVSGMVKGDVTAFGGDVRVTATAAVFGDLNTIGGSSQIDSGAAVYGNRVTGVSGLPFGLPARLSSPGAWLDLGPGAGILSAVFSALILALLAMLVTVFLPVPTNRVAQTIGTQPVITGAIGLLTLVVTPALTLVLVITIILIPLGIIGLLVFAIAFLYGWIALGLELGKRLAVLLHTQWAIPVSAGVGTLMLSLSLNLALVFTAGWFWMLCCVGLPIAVILGMVGLGGVVTSRFGAQVYSPNAARPVPPAAGGFPPSGGFPPAVDLPPAQALPPANPPDFPPPQPPAE
jgi:hypothetical protein